MERLEKEEFLEMLEDFLDEEEEVPSNKKLYELMGEIVEYSLNATEKQWTKECVKSREVPQFKPASAYAQALGSFAGPKVIEMAIRETTNLSEEDVRLFLPTLSQFLGVMEPIITIAVPPDQAFIDKANEYIKLLVAEEITNSIRLVVRPQFCDGILTLTLEHVLLKKGKKKPKKNQMSRAQKASEEWIESIKEHVSGLGQVSCDHILDHSGETESIPNFEDIRFSGHSGMKLSVRAEIIRKFSITDVDSAEQLVYWASDIMELGHATGQCQIQSLFAESLSKKLTHGLQKLRIQVHNTVIDDDNCFKVFADESHVLNFDGRVFQVQGNSGSIMSFPEADHLDAYAFHKKNGWYSWKPKINSDGERHEPFSLLVDSIFGGRDSERALHWKFAIHKVPYVERTNQDILNERRRIAQYGYPNKESLFIYIKSGDMESINAILYEDANALKYLNYGWETVFMSAARHGRLDLCKRLINEFRVDLNERVREDHEFSAGIQAIHIAVYEYFATLTGTGLIYTGKTYQYHETLVYLIASGGDVDSKCPSNYHPRSVRDYAEMEKDIKAALEQGLEQRNQSTAV